MCSVHRNEQRIVRHWHVVFWLSELCGWLQNVVGCVVKGWILCVVTKCGRMCCEGVNSVCGSKMWCLYDLNNQHTSPKVFILLSFLSYIVSTYVFVYNNSVFIYLCILYTHYIISLHIIIIYQTIKMVVNSHYTLQNVCFPWFILLF